MQIARRLRRSRPSSGFIFKLSQRTSSSEFSLRGARRRLSHESRRDVAAALASAIRTGIIKMTVIVRGGLDGGRSNQGYLLPGDPVTSFMRGRVPIIPSSPDPRQANNVTDDKVRSCSSRRLLSSRHRAGSVLWRRFHNAPSSLACQGPFVLDRPER